MAKKLTYLILPNHHLYQKYKGPSLAVFEDKDYSWLEVPQFSGYWGEMKPKTVYNHRALLKVLKSVVDDTSDEPCDWNKERLFLYSNLYCQMKIGETIFIRYEDTNPKPPIE